MESLEVKNVMEPKTRKRKRYGRLSDANKKMNLQSHEMGSDCNCTRQCFQNIPEYTRKAILQQFNSLQSHDQQNTYLCGLISVLPVNRPSKKEDAKHCAAVYKYKLRGPVKYENEQTIVEEFDVCKIAFMSVHGIGRKKIEYLVNSIKETGCAPSDKRGKHNNHKHALKVEVISCVRQHINSFKGRESHYSLHDSKKLYLPEDLNISLMFKMFK